MFLHCPDKTLYVQLLVLRADEVSYYGNKMWNR